MNYQIIATLGPKSNRPEIWSEMLSAGASAFRLNTSHISLLQLGNWLDTLQQFFSRIPSPPHLILDLQGSKWRLGEMQTINLIEGQQVSLMLGETTQFSEILPVPHIDFFEAAQISDGEIILNDARVRLRIDEMKSNLIRAHVVLGGEISSHKGITLADSSYRKESLNAKDLAIIEQSKHMRFVQFALSYVKDTIEMQHFQRQIGADVPLIAKLERQPAVDEAVEIAAMVEALWLCRGDLGAELGLCAMAEAVHRFSAHVKEIPTPVILAGQVLEHMTNHTVSTRSELCYLYDALVKGYCGVVLSDETAVGVDPVGAVRAAAMFRTP